MNRISIIMILCCAVGALYPMDQGASDSLVEQKPDDHNGASGLSSSDQTPEEIRGIEAEYRQTRDEISQSMPGYLAPFTDPSLPARGFFNRDKDEDELAISSMIIQVLREHSGQLQRITELLNNDVMCAINGISHDQRREFAHAGSHRETICRSLASRQLAAQRRLRTLDSAIPDGFETLNNKNRSITQILTTMTEDIFAIKNHLESQPVTPNTARPRQTQNHEKISRMLADLNTRLVAIERVAQETNTAAIQTKNMQQGQRFDMTLYAGIASAGTAICVSALVTWIINKLRHQDEKPHVNLVDVAQAD